MSYIVLARKYRPQTFDELTGQEHITHALGDAIKVKRVGSAYLFCGPRGVGKTSCARIFAKSLNCQKGPTPTPCGECPACLEIAKATSFDVIEIDGASNRGIDEIRALRENVKFAPSYGRYKVYIVDEVHMLTIEAFNALLKTLEEPPEHTKFIFATTAPSKVPATIISRCQRFDFRRIAIETISKVLLSVCHKEKLKIDDEALFSIAKAASGSLRDALSILDQIGALNQKEIKAKDVTTMLGIVELDLIFKLADSLAAKDCSKALKVFDEIISQGKDIRQLGKDLIEHFRHLMVIKVGGKSLGSLVDYPIATKELLLAQADQFTLVDLVKTIETFVEAQDMIRTMDFLRIPFEIAFAKLTYNPQSVKPSSEHLKTADIKPQKVITDAKPVKLSSSTSARSPFEEKSDFKGHAGPVVQHFQEETMEDLSLGANVATLQAPVEVDIDSIRQIWNSVTHAVSRKKMSVATFLQEGSPMEVKGGRLTIGFPTEAQFHKESLEDKDNIRLIEDIIAEKLSTLIRIDLRIIANYKPQDDSGVVKSALETFKGKVVNKWHSE